MIGRLFYGVALACVAFMFGMFGLWVADRDIPVVGIQSKVLNNDVAPGQVVRVQLTAYRIRSCHTIIERYVEDSTTTRFAYPDIDYINPGPPGHITSIIEVPMPPRINTGLATIKTNAAWECNPFHKIWPITDRQPDIGILITSGK